MNSFASLSHETKKKRLNRSTTTIDDEDFTKNGPIVGQMNKGQRFLDAANLELLEFRLEDFALESLWNYMTHLYLSRNRLRKIPENIFEQMKNLEWLDLRWNELETFPATVKHHQSLKTILLQDNNLTKLPIELGTLEQIHCLAVTNNPLIWPGKDVMTKCRTNANLINFLKRCWELQTYNVPIEDAEEKSAAKRKRPIGKFVQLKTLKDHTEVICRLKNSGKIRDQIKAEKMQRDLELQQKVLQNFKDQDVLKKWRDKYRGQSATVTAHYEPNFPQGCVKNQTSIHSGVMKYFTGDVNAAMSDLENELSKFSTSAVSHNPEQTIRTKKHEIEAIKNIHKRISYLKHRS